MLKRGLKIALVQLSVGPDKAKNVAEAVKQIHQAKSKGAQLVALPECFNSPYGTKYFDDYAEEVPTGETSKALSKAAAEAGICVVGGTLPERAGNKLYNICTVWDGSGKLLAQHRKVSATTRVNFLDDADTLSTLERFAKNGKVCGRELGIGFSKGRGNDIPNKITFMESEVLSAGDQLTTFEYQGIKIGVGICYDLRFYESAHLMAKQGCSILIYPAAFNMTTGPRHWELLARARANDLQLWVALVSPARDENASYVAWGHTIVVDPWGNVVQQLDEKPGVLMADMDLKVVEEVRSQIPIRSQRRTDIYDTITKTK